MEPIDASHMITDEYSAKILVATYGKEMDAIEMSQELGIPIAACYRRIHVLEDAGIIECSRVVEGKRGKKIKKYRSRLRNAFIFFELGRLRVRFQMATGENLDFGTNWEGVKIDGRYM